MDIDVRTITDAEVGAWSAGMATGYLKPADAADVEIRRSGLYLDRTWGAFDRDRVVGTLFSFPAELTVPGGARLRTSAVTGVSTTATHRRRGLLTRMVAGELAATARRGEQASILIAAEWLIYCRFGYAAATENQTWTLDARAGRLREVPPGTVEFVDRDTARALALELFERYRAARPGEISRTERYWDLNFGILRYPSWPEPKPCLSVVARDRNGTVAGLARYEYADRWQGRLLGGDAVVQTFLADGPAGEALLWHHLLSLD